MMLGSVLEVFLHRRTRRGAEHEIAVKLLASLQDVRCCCTASSAVAWINRLLLVQRPSASWWDPMPPPISQSIGLPPDRRVPTNRIPEGCQPMRVLARHRVLTFHP